MKAAGGLGPDAGKTGGTLDKDTLPAENESPYADYDPSTDPYASGGGSSDGGGSGDGGGSRDGGSGGYTGDGGGSGTEPDTEADSEVDAETDSGDGADDPGSEPDAETDDPLHADSDPDDDSLVQEDFETERPTRPLSPEEPQPPNPNQVSIDIEAMTRLVAAMERAGEQIQALREEMRSILSGVHLTTSETNRFEEVSAWIADELPGLRRRLAMAQDLAGEGGFSTQPDRPQVPRPYVGDESRLPVCPPSESYENARNTAQRFTLLHDADTTRQLVAELRAGRHDPYYAREFAHTADPETLVRAIVSAGDGEGSAELTELTASTVATASRGTGELSPPAGYEEQWAALRESDDPEVAAAAARLRPA
ncbi:hypothetical protein [Jiangella gansuensis]|uniref:hypothetical protein n=1 Tax=Jiangella gansuensis TaxID=281473 RepID=UPI00047E4F1B|nr:hypothetical protein [Jiangella gansuensis]